MPPLPDPPEPRQSDGGSRLPFAHPDQGRAFGIDVPRYFIEVNIPGYDLEKAVARARRRVQKRLQRSRGESGDDDPA